MTSRLEKPFAVVVPSVQLENEHYCVAAAMASLHHYQETGLHITLYELKQWAKAVRENRGIKIQPCHK